MPLTGRLFASLLCLALSGCSFFDSKLVSVCEEVLKDRLRSPATYKRIKITEYKEAISVDQWVAYWNEHREQEGRPNERLALLTIEPDRKPFKFSAFISSDAANAYGTPIRSTTRCEYFSPDGEMDPATYDVLVDGLTGTEWLIQQVENARK